MCNVLQINSQQSKTLNLIEISIRITITHIWFLTESRFGFKCTILMNRNAVSPMGFFGNGPFWLRTGTALDRIYQRIKSNLPFRKFARIFLRSEFETENRGISSHLLKLLWKCRFCQKYYRWVPWNDASLYLTPCLFCCITYLIPPTVAFLPTLEQFIAAISII